MNDNATLAQRLLQAEANGNTQEAATLAREWAAAFDREAKNDLWDVLRARPNSMHAAFMNCATLLVMKQCAARRRSLGGRRNFSKRPKKVTKTGHFWPFQVMRAGAFTAAPRFSMAAC